MAHLRRIFLFFGVLVAEHYTKIDRTSNRVQLWRICAAFFGVFPALAGRGWLPRRAQRRYGATVARLRRIFFDACWISFLIHIMLFNFVIRIAEHPARADKSAVGAINRPLWRAGLECTIILTLYHRVYHVLQSPGRSTDRATDRSVSNRELRGLRHARPLMLALHR